MKNLLLAFTLVSFTLPAAVLAEQRTALVIGNSAYATGRLANPVNDAKAMAATLQGLGFRVISRFDARKDALFAAMREFGDVLRKGGVGLFYFAGHGVQSKGSNYLVPVDASIQREDEIRSRAVDLVEVLDKMESARNRINIVILDACRDNPFASSRSLGRGLVRVDAPIGTLIAFATAPGKTADDGRGANSPYTKHLLANLPKPGLKLEDVFKLVRSGVRNDTHGAQIPWENTSLEGDFYFVPGSGGQGVTIINQPPVLGPSSNLGADGSGAILEHSQNDNPLIRAARDSNAILTAKLAQPYDPSLASYRKVSFVEMLADKEALDTVPIEVRGYVGVSGAYASFANINPHDVEEMLKGYHSIQFNISKLPRDTRLYVMETCAGICEGTARGRLILSPYSVPEFFADQFVRN